MRKRVAFTGVQRIDDVADGRRERPERRVRYGRRGRGRGHRDCRADGIRFLGAEARKRGADHDAVRCDAREGVVASGSRLREAGGRERRGERADGRGNADGRQCVRSSRWARRCLSPRLRLPPRTMTLDKAVASAVPLVWVFRRTSVLRRARRRSRAPRIRHQPRRHPRANQHDCDQTALSRVRAWLGPPTSWRPAASLPHASCDLPPSSARSLPPSSRLVAQRGSRTNCDGECSERSGRAPGTSGSSYFRSAPPARRRTPVGQLAGHQLVRHQVGVERQRNARLTTRKRRVSDKNVSGAGAACRRPQLLGSRHWSSWRLGCSVAAHTGGGHGGFSLTASTPTASGSEPATAATWASSSQRQTNSSLPPPRNFADCVARRRGPHCACRWRCSSTCRPRSS
jgi:hypothetical protein